MITPLLASLSVFTAPKAGSSIFGHYASRVSTLDLAANALRELGYMPVGEVESAVVAYLGSWVKFFLDPLRFFVEPIEAPEDRCSFSKVPRSIR